MPKTRREFSPEFKREAVADAAQEDEVTGAARFDHQCGREFGQAGRVGRARRRQVGAGDDVYRHRGALQVSFTPLCRDDDVAELAAARRCVRLRRLRACG